MENEMTVKISKRIFAYMLDIFLIFVLCGLITSIKFINPTYNKYLDYYEKYTNVLEDYTNENITEEEMLKLNEENFYYVTKYSVSYNIVIILVLIGYFGFFQKFNKGQTLGKKIMKIKVVCVEGKQNVSMWKYLLRTLPNYYIYVGSIIPLALNSILVFILNKKTFMITNSFITYGFLILAVISLVLMCTRSDRRSLYDIIAKTKVVNE